MVRLCKCSSPVIQWYLSQNYITFQIFQTRPVPVYQVSFNDIIARYKISYTSIAHCQDSAFSDISEELRLLPYLPRWLCISAATISDTIFVKMYKIYIANQQSALKASCTYAQSSESLWNTLRC